MEKGIKRKLTAILSADVAGYSRLMSEDEVSTVRTLQDYRNTMSDLIIQHNGRVVDSPGDNLMAEFASVVDSVQCAMEIQEVLRAKNDELPENRKMMFRIGINLGDVIEEDGRIYGDGVNIAARIESLSEPGGICISGTAYEQVWNKLDLGYDDLGEHQVKNIQKPIRVYKIPVKPKEYFSDSLLDLSVPTDKPSIAVLPFVNMSGDPEQEYFSDGMAEEIITALSKVPYLLVIARNSTFTYKGKTINIKQVGKELGAKYVLEGSVRKAGNRLRVTAQLIDAASGNHIWADRYDRDLKDIFELQDEITARILSELKLRIDFDLRTKVSIKYTDNLEAYLRWWQGSSHLSRLNKDDNALARKLFKEVVQLDPNWAVGYSHLGIVSIMDYMGGWCCSPDKCIEEAITYAKKANSLDNTNPDPYAILSYVMLVKKQYDEAIAEAEKAISVEPGFFYGYNSLGIALLYSGKPEKAFETFKKALSLNPKQNVWFQCNFGLALCHLGRYIEAIDLLKTAIRKMPFYILSHACLTASYILAGMKDEARKQAKEILRIDPNFSVDNFADRIPYKNQSDTDRILNALRKAGLK